MRSMDLIKEFQANSFVLDQNLVGKRVLYRTPPQRMQMYDWDRNGRVRTIPFTCPATEHETTVLVVTECGRAFFGTPKGELVGTRASAFDTPWVKRTIETANIDPDTRVVLTYRNQLKSLLTL